MGSPGSQAWGSGLELHHQLPGGPSLQMADCGTSQLPLSREPIFHNKSLSVCLSIDPISSVFLRTPITVEHLSVLCYV